MNKTFEDDNSINHNKLMKIIQNVYFFPWKKFYIIFISANTKFKVNF